MKLRGLMAPCAGAMLAFAAGAAADQPKPPGAEAKSEAPQAIDTIMGAQPPALGFPGAFPGAMPGAMPGMPMWPQQMMPFPGTMPGMPMPPMMWPMLSPVPAPMVTPSGVPVIWVPFALVPVPAGPAASDGAAAAPSPTTGPAGAERAAAQGATPAAKPMAVEKPAAAANPPAASTAPRTDKTPGSAAEKPATPSAVPDGAGEATRAEPRAAAPVDYGPVTPTPVIYLDPPAPDAKAAPRQRKASKPATKPASATGAKPTKKRLCWSAGVVAPCR